MKTKEKWINLLPKEYIYQQKVHRRFLFVLAAIAIEMVLFIGIAVLPPCIEKSVQKRALEQLEEMIDSTKYDKVHQTMKELEKEKQTLKLWQDKYKSMNKETFITNETLETILALLPAEVTIDSLEMDAMKQSIIIQGKSDTPTAFLTYMAHLELAFCMSDIDFEMDHAKQDNLSSIGYKITIEKQQEKNETEEIEGGEIE